jgi:hypothetical protein
MSQLLFLKLSKAILLPSADIEGAKSFELLKVRRLRPEPSEFIV